ncbi:MAG TPA: metal ABC transporter substrate-binding protein [Acidimicrobiales bacterium]|nr:metal ABC transporter substrate-binding protein [Acidimicrobiales bacterium]
MRRIVLAVLVVFAACGDNRGNDDGRPTVVASFFPLAELARAVGGADVVVHDLTPPGVESHDYEPSTRDIDRIEDADVVLYLGGGFQPAIERTAGRAQKAVDLLASARADGDPHLWLDPTAMVAWVDVVARAVGVDHAGDFRRALRDLDDEYRRRLAPCRSRVIVTTHDAFGHLARRYNLEQQPLTGITPDAEPDPKRLAELADLVRARGVTTVFTEGTDDAKAAEALAREAGVRTAVLSTLEQPVDGGYIAGMRRNLDTLTQALQC